jgi:hypothetical protein
MSNLLANPLFLVLFIVIVCIAVVTAIYIILPLAVKRGIDVSKELSKAEGALNVASTVIDTVDKVMPNNPIINVVKVVKDWTIDAVHEAEQMYLASQLDKDARYNQAKDTVYSALKLSNIEVTPEVEKIINGTIQAECLALGHTDDNTKIIQNQLQTANSQLQQQLQIQNQQIQDLQSTNANLTQKLSNIQATATQ